MGTAEGDSAAMLKKRADKLRECARDARKTAQRLGKYLDDAVKKAAPRTGNPRAQGGDAIWLGPFADQCTQTLQTRQSKLSHMATALLADATRWENIARELDAKAKAKGHGKGTEGAHS
ncbi:hypothetical protein ABZS71_09915 [Streptomyces sp. NPDC005393]|uniref:hypothetical protein n=1 Tax=Streptomyces sp. NPDC005393 TaxID=3157041 RepID=UPI0033BC2EC2